MRKVSRALALTTAATLLLTLCFASMALAGTYTTVTYNNINNATLTKGKGFTAQASFRITQPGYCIESYDVSVTAPYQNNTNKAAYEWGQRNSSSVHGYWKVSYNSNTQSYNINGVDKALNFNLLPKGNYNFRLQIGIWKRNKTGLFPQHSYDIYNYYFSVR